MHAQPRPPVLLTRPAAQSARFASQMQARFGPLEVVISPLMAPVFLRPDLPAGPFDAVIFTSETGVAAARAAGWALPGLAVCVGDRTAAAATEAGFAARSAGGDAEALVAMLRAGSGAGRLLHLRAAEARGDVAARLTAAGFPTDEAAVYDQRPAPLSEAARALLAGDRAVVVPLFSPRSAALLAVAARGCPAPLWVAAFSPAVAAGIAAARMVVAARPEAIALLEALEMFLGG
ncbi:MAG: uroporphyrinogen-III synthase [Gemmobacter sp.]